MDWERRCIRFCAAMLVGAVALRLADSPGTAKVMAGLRSPQAASFLVYLQTGRVVRPAQAATLPQEQPEPAGSQTQPTLPEFSPEDAQAVDIRFNCAYRPDLQQLLTRPLAYDLSGEPAVLILHTHTTESYTPEPDASYTQTSAYRTLDPDHNMLRVGQQVAQRLEEAGIRVIHDRTVHDHPSYNDSYNHAADATRSYLQQYPDIRLVLDLHRDAADTPAGQLVTACTVDGKESAQLMLVVGTDAGGLEHPGWQENLSLALKLQVLLERENPGICRQSALTYQRFNQHFAPGALLVEVGAAGNTLPEALTAADALAEAVIRLFHG